VMLNPEYRPRPTSDGIFAEIEINTLKMLSRTRSSYDYWAARKNGDFYLLKSLFEDERHPDGPRVIFFNTRIGRATEMFLHCARLYSALGLDPSTYVNIAVRYSSLQGREMSTSNSGRWVPPGFKTSEDTVETSATSPLSAIEANLVPLVKQITNPLFILFDFYEVKDPIYEQIVNDYVSGKVT
ncbi:MAG: hypothetical protein Q7O66_15285, partial [Dehalococcoidia bacterium]|nr:hypothetical protein [Dehalococcoidia bacterium]